ncbi:LOW QUALITY PROTEIN: cadherin-24 [Brachyhypopomus gauderio]|uniref:LOW QUALITY PROTEIN: cadherin-24 n=1 Tax=Brachyhypopomus gauderio TaxID=698409 RepID=UPI00404243A8
MLRSVWPRALFLLLILLLLLLHTSGWDGPVPRGRPARVGGDPHALSPGGGTRGREDSSAPAGAVVTEPRSPAPAGTRLTSEAAAVFPFDVGGDSGPNAAGLALDAGHGGGAGALQTGHVGGTGESRTRTRTRARVRRSWIWNQFFVIEEYSGPEPVLIGRLHSSMDRGDGRTKYILTGEGAGSVFVIDGKTGNIHVTKPLDREEKDQYRLIATATDRQTGQALEASSQFVIRVQDINDNSPVFPQAHYSATVPEMASIGTSVTQVTAMDADDQTYGNSARLVYSVLQGQQYFTVDPQSGILRTAVSDMDREVQSEYVVVLQARDMGGHQGGLTGTTSINVHLSDVNDNPPRFTSSAWSFSVSELALPGVEVGRVSATDADVGENARLDFTIAEGEGGDTFNITGLNQEGVIILNKVVDYERRSLYTLSVEVQNPIVDGRFMRRGPFKDRAVVRITVLNADEPPRFSRSRYRLDVAENCPPACAVGRITAVDPDTGLSSNIKYSIDPESDPEALFRIAPDNGLITTAMELDREHERWHNITVIATQRDSPNQVTRVAVAIETLDLNDNAPELDRQYSTAVCDSSAPGQVIQVIRAVDRDQTSPGSSTLFSLPGDGGLPLNLTLQERGDHTASLVLRSSIKALPHSASSSRVIKIPIILRDSASELSSTGTVTVATCLCREGGMQTEERKRERDGGSGVDVPEWEKRLVCVAQLSRDAPLGLSSLTLLGALGLSSALLVVVALTLSVRRQKSDTLSPLEDEEIRENIITYDDEGGGEADTAAFDIATLKSAPPSLQRALRPGHSRNACSGISRAQSPAAVSTAIYGQYCYSIHTPLGPGVELATLACPPPHSLGHASKQPGAGQGAGPAKLCKSVEQSSSSDVNVKEDETGSDVISERQNQSQEQSLHSEAPVLHSFTCDTTHSGAPPSGLPAHHTSTSTTTSPAATDDSTSTPAPNRLTDALINTSQTTAPRRHLQPFRTMEGTLLRGGGGIPAGTTCLYPEAAELMGVYTLARRDYAPQLFMPFPGRAGLYMGGRGLDRCGRECAGRGGSNSLTHRMGDFLEHRLAQVTYDPMQPPYDSLQTYGLEGAGSQATSLSSLESEGERGMGEEEERLDEWGPKFQKLMEIFTKKERETEEDKMVEEQEKPEVKDEGMKEERKVEWGKGDETEEKRYSKKGESAPENVGEDETIRD